MIDDIEKNKFIRVFLDKLDNNKFDMNDYYDLIDKFAKLNNNQKLGAMLDIIILRSELT